MSLSNYPPGVNDSTWDAPWTEPSIPEKDFEITCSQSLSKTVIVTTDNYIPGASGCDYEDGVTIGWHDDDDTSETNWGEEYHANDYHTPQQLIALFKKCLEENMEKGVVFRSERYTKSLIEECEGWVEDDLEFVEE